MTKTNRAGTFRRPERSRGAGANFLELFFDLVFVVALAQLSQGLIQDLTWGSAFQTLLLLLGIWYVWTSTTWTTDLYDTQRPAIALLVIATMLGTLLMVVALPEAFGRRGLLFAGTYVVIHIGRELFILALSGTLQRRTVRLLFSYAVSAVPWIAGALVSGTAREVLWALAVALDYVSASLRNPTPGLGSSSKSEFPIHAGHLAERHRQLFIIALGELILISALTLTRNVITGDRTAAFVVSFVGTALFWQIYIYRTDEELPAAIAAARDMDRVARGALVLHLIMLAGTVTTAVGQERVIAHPLEHTQPAGIAVILGGPALFLAGRGAFDYAVAARVSWSRPIGVLLLAAVIPVALHVPPLLTALAATAVLGGIAVWDAACIRRRPSEPPSRPG